MTFVVYDKIRYFLHIVIKLVRRMFARDANVPFPKHTARALDEKPPEPVASERPPVVSRDFYYEEPVYYEVPFTDLAREGYKLHPDLRSVHLAAARHLFGVLGVEYVPHCMLELLKELEVSGAFVQFLASIGVEYEALLQQEHEMHWGSIERFQDGVEVLVEMDALRRRRPLKAEPIYTVLREAEIIHAESLLDRMRVAIHLLDAFEKCAAPFGDFQEKKSDIVAGLYEWENNDDEDYEQLTKYLSWYERSSDEFELHCFGIGKRAKWLERMLDKGDVLYGTFSKILTYARKTEEELRIGKIAAVDGMEIIRECVEDLHVLCEEVARRTGIPFELDGEFRSERRDDCESKRAFHLAVLEISEHASFAEAQKAFRKKAKVYHPDKNPGREAWAAEKMAEVNEAYACFEKRKPKKGVA